MLYLSIFFFHQIVCPFILFPSFPLLYPHTISFLTLCILKKKNPIKHLMFSVCAWKRTPCWGLGTLPRAVSLKTTLTSQQPPVAKSSWARVGALWAPPPLHVGILAGWILCGSRVSSHRCYKLMCATPWSFRQILFYWQYPLFLAPRLSTCSSVGPEARGVVVIQLSHS